jgi:hypothetical protein
MQNIETILSLEPKSESHYIVEYILMNQFPQIMTNPELRKDYLSLSLVHDIDWLAPLVVMVDYFTYYEDPSTEQLEAFIEFMVGITASMNESKLAKTLKGAFFGDI